MSDLVRKRTMSPAETARMENAEAKAEVNRANIDYIAMMTDVEIPTEEEAEDHEPEV